MCDGLAKYGKKKHHLFLQFTTEGMQGWPAGEYNGVRFLTPSICAIMNAMGYIPMGKECNTPNERYGWDFHECRAIQGAIDAIGNGNLYYWREYVEMYRPELVDKTRRTALPDPHLRPLTFSGWPKTIDVYRHYAEILKKLRL